MAYNFVDVPGHPGLRVQIWTHGKDTLCLAWTGTAHDLLAAGVATQAMLDLVGTGEHQSRDEHGYAPRIRRSFGVRNGEPYVRYQVFRKKPRAVAMGMPGVAEALELYQIREARFSQILDQLLPLPRKAVPTRPSYLRLVVDNDLAEAPL